MGAPLTNFLQLLSCIMLVLALITTAVTWYLLLQTILVCLEVRKLFVGGAQQP